MIRAHIRNSVGSEECIITVDTPIKDAFDRAGLDPGAGLVNVNGRQVNDLSQTFAGLGVADDSDVFVASVVKTNNA